MPTSGATQSAGVRTRSEAISSRENRWLKMFRAALRGTDLLAEGLAGIEGPRIVADAVSSQLEMTALLWSESGERHLAAIEGRLAPATRLLRTSDRLFESVTGTRTPQGIAALVRPRRFGFDDLLKAGPGQPLVVVLVDVQDPGNVGTLIRTAEAFGASGAIATAGTAHPWSPKAVRASAGSIFRLPLLEGIGPAVALAQLGIAGVTTYATTAAEGPSPSQVDLTAPVALLIGNEGAGLPPEIARSANSALHIPVAGTVESLNAAMAATVVLYEAARQRGFSS